MWWMDIIANIGFWIAKIGANMGNEKLKKWIEGRENLSQKIQQKIAKDDQVIWFHAASYGEFEEGRPILEQMRIDYPNHKIAVTFFSPSGYEPNRNYPMADVITYLPLDTQKEVKQFLDALHPQIAIFIKYEFWHNLLHQLYTREIKTYVISARFIPNSRFFKWYGKIFRKALTLFDTIFVQDARSVELLHKIQIENVVQAGDPRFDRVKKIAEEHFQDPIIEQFKSHNPLFVVGSMLPDQDQLYIQELINTHPTTKFLIVPHDMDILPMEKMKRETKRETKIYSQCDTKTDFSNTQVLILDQVGKLSKLYRYADWAYIGGGFDLGIHSVIEATIYGVPAVFGTNYHKNRPAIEMVQDGICTSISNQEQLERWFAPLENNQLELDRLKQKAAQYTRQQCGATAVIIEYIKQTTAVEK